MARWALGAAGAVLLPGAALAQDLPFVEPPLTVEAAQFVPSELMSGTNHKVHPNASNDGFANTYSVGTPWGDVAAHGDYRLRVRIQEANALRALDEMNKAGVFGDSMVEGAMAPIKAAGDLITNPVETVSGAVDGVGRWFGNIADSATSDDPHQEGAISAAVGWAQTKRAYAVELGVDPYTDWKPLDEALVSVARAAFAGGITAKVAVGAATRNTVLELPVLALGLTNTMKKKLVDNPPERLAEQHRAELGEIGIPESAIGPFLKNHNYSPLEKLQLVEAVKRMKGAAGLEAVVVNAARAPEKQVARYMQQQAEMMARIYESSKFSVIGTEKSPALRMEDGRIVGVFPLEFVSWTERLATFLPDFTAQVDAGGEPAGREIWLEGVVSQDARKGLEANGWTVKEKVQLLLAAK